MGIGAPVRHEENSKGVRSAAADVAQVGLAFDARDRFSCARPTAAEYFSFDI